MFSLDTQMVKIAGVNLRSEKVDDELVSACDIVIIAELPNDVLLEFHPLLKDSFYRRDENAQTDMINGDSHRPILKFPGFPNFPWKTTLDGYQFIAHTGIGGKSEISLIDCKLNKISFNMKEGGTVKLKFIVRAHANPKDVGKLSTLIETEVQITLVPPDEAKQYELDQAKAQRRAAAEGAFKDKHTQALPIDDDDDVVDAEFDSDFHEVGDVPAPDGKGGKSKVLQPAEAWPFPTDNSKPTAKKSGRRASAADTSTLE